MKNFLTKYSYDSVVLLIYQIAIGVFGMVLALAAGMAGNDALRTASSIFAIAFLLFLQYTSVWKIGANDRISHDLHGERVDYTVPLKMWLLSNSLNLLLALLISLGMWFEGAGVLDTIGGIATVIKLIAEGMYTGVLAINVGGAPLNSYWFMHFLTTVPTCIIICLAYVLGFNNVTLKKKK